MEFMKKPILVITSVADERDAVLRGLNNGKNIIRMNIDVQVSGVGPVAAAAKVARSLAQGDYGLVLCLGIAGGFQGKAELGTVVVAEEIIAADLGAETPEGFSSIEQLGFGSVRYNVDDVMVGKMAALLKQKGLPVTTGPVVTVSTATGTIQSAKEIAARVPGVVAEGMEGFGMALAASQMNIPFMEVRAISNIVGPRDRAAWRIREALEVVETASSVLTEVF